MTKPDQDPPDAEYARPHGPINRFFERVTSIPADLIFRGAVSDAAKRRLYEEGIKGRAEILKAPSKYGVSEAHENVGGFRVRIELEDRIPYEAKVRQSFGKDEWDQMQPGAVVECRVDRDRPNRVLLVPPQR